MQFKLLLILFFVTSLLGFGAFGQKSHTLQVIANPFIYQFGNLNNQYTSIENDYIEAKFTNTPTMEYGLSYHQNFEGRWGWGIGSTWKNLVHKTQFNLYTINYWNSTVGDTIKSYYFETKIQHFSIKANVSYKLSSRFTINAFLGVYFPVYEETNYTKTQFTMASSITTIEPDTTYAQGLFLYDTRIYRDFKAMSPRFVPELNVNYRFYKGFSATAGLRLKFWKTANDDYLSMEVNGYAGVENYGTNEIIHRSDINAREFSFYFGLMYDISFKRKQKVVAVE
ncbi:MAG: hypothetical protein QNK23_14460 [Crocinitomicaceae bacterium]|nr:hypothetical protein [Crocinitomicaceae bacterium]